MNTKAMFGKKKEPIRSEVLGQKLTLRRLIELKKLIFLGYLEKEDD